MRNEKSRIKKFVTFHFSFITYHLSLIILLFSLFLINCSDSHTDQEMGTFTISFGGISRTTIPYPPNFPTVENPPAGAPTSNDLKFEVVFTEVGGHTEETFTFNPGENISGEIAVGTYAVTMNVLYLDDTPYAQGIAQNNPIVIRSGPNSVIRIKVNDPNDAQPPLIIVQPINAHYLLGSTPQPLIVEATSMDNGTLSYQWYRNTVNSTTGATQVGTNDPSYTPVISTVGTEVLFYYVVITNTRTGAVTPTATVTSNIVNVSVVDSPVFLSSNGTSGPYVGHSDLNSAMNFIAANPGNYDYDVRIGTNQNLGPRTFNSPIPTMNITLRAWPALNTVTVQLFNNGRLFTVNDNVTLTLDAGITLRGRNADDNGQDNNGSVIQVNSGGELIMNPLSLITGNRASTSAGGVLLSANSTFTMEGGEISGNTSSTGGVDVYGNFTMKGGEISDNTGTSYTGSGGVYVASGDFIMEGGRISGNRATGGDGRGGGVQVLGGTFTMIDGEISGNTANTNGGGVYLIANSTFTMIDGEISGNTAGSAGGGVNVAFTIVNGVFMPSTFVMNGGEIFGNTAGSSGGGVNFAINSTFTKEPAAGSSTSGTIYGYDLLNTADPNNNRVWNTNTNTPISDRGHAVWVNASTKRETTVLPTDDLGWDGTTATGNWTDP